MMMSKAKLSKSIKNKTPENISVKSAAKTDKRSNYEAKMKQITKYTEVFDKLNKAYNNLAHRKVEANYDTDTVYGKPSAKPKETDKVTTKESIKHVSNKSGFDEAKSVKSGSEKSQGVKSNFDFERNKNFDLMFGKSVKDNSENRGKVENIEKQLKTSNKKTKQNPNQLTEEELSKYSQYLPSNHSVLENSIREDKGNCNDCHKVEQLVKKSKVGELNVKCGTCEKPFSASSPRSEPIFTKERFELVIGSDEEKEKKSNPSFEPINGEKKDWRRKHELDDEFLVWIEGTKSYNAERNLTVQDIYRNKQRKMEERKNEPKAKSKTESHEVAIDSEVFKKKQVTEVNPELLKRLLDGKKADLSDKEQRMLNKRLYEKLVVQKEDAPEDLKSKTEDMRARAVHQKEFAEVKS